MSFNILAEDTASADVRPILAQVKGKYGFVPNLIGTFANAPATLKAYLGLAEYFESTSLTPTERQIVLLATSFANDCAYCMAAHTVIAGMQNVSGEIIEALRNNTPISDSKLESLRRYAHDITASRGYPSHEVAKDFFAAGYTSAHTLEVVLGVSMKTLSNYTNHIANTPLDDSFAKAAWEAPAPKCHSGCCHS